MKEVFSLMDLIHSGKYIEENAFNLVIPVCKLLDQDQC